MKEWIIIIKDLTFIMFVVFIYSSVGYFTYHIHDLRFVDLTESQRTYNYRGNDGQIYVATKDDWDLSIGVGLLWPIGLPMTSSIYFVEKLIGAEL